jgi:hypothetical protein
MFQKNDIQKNKVISKYIMKPNKHIMETNKQN